MIEADLCVLPSNLGYLNRFLSRLGKIPAGGLAGLIHNPNAPIATQFDRLTVLSSTLPSTLILGLKKSKIEGKTIPTKILVGAIHELPLLIFKQNPHNSVFSRKT
jgi:hypothetical protein